MQTYISKEEYEVLIAVMENLGRVLDATVQYMKSRIDTDTSGHKESKTYQSPSGAYQAFVDTGEEKEKE